MLQYCRNWLVLLLVVLLTACGGEGISLDGSGAGTPTEDGSTDNTSLSVASYSLSLSLTDNLGNTIAEVSQLTPGKLKAQLTRDGSPLEGELVKFETQYTGVISPSVGTAITDSSGVATVSLLPGTTEGAGTAQVSYTLNEENRSATLNFFSAGDGESDTVSTNYSLKLSLVNATTLVETTQISASNPGKVNVTVSDSQGEPVANRVISFTTTLGTFSPTSATALTDNDGKASILLKAGTVEGAGEVTAYFGDNSVKTGFYTLGDEDDGTTRVDFALSILDCNDVPGGWDRQQRDASECVSTNNISSSQPGILFIKATRAGSSDQALADILVRATADLGTLAPESGTAITDGNGIAILDLLAGNDAGAGIINVQALNAEGIDDIPFQIGATNLKIALGSSLADSESLAAGSTMVISVELFEDDGVTPYVTPVSVELNSACATAGTAVLDSPVVSVGGVARATYRADGCAGQDTITATATTGGQALTDSITFEVDQAEAGSIRFVSATPTVLALKGTGGLLPGLETSRSESSVVIFQLIDNNGNAIRQKQVDFELISTIGGLTLEPSSATTDNDGKIQTVVRSGSVGGVVRVLAKYHDTSSDDGAADITISAPSDLLTISTGIPDQNSFSLSASVFNPEALNYDGEEVELTIRAADHFNNPVPDGTAVYFTTEGGTVQVVDGSGDTLCLTTGGACAVNWISQDPRPGYIDGRQVNANRLDDSDTSGALLHDCAKFEPVDTSATGVAPCINENGMGQPYGGRASVLAVAVGEESFVDSNGNGQFDSNEYRSDFDLTEAFIDFNEDGVFGGVQTDGTPDAGASSAADPTCYYSTEDCYQAGGDDEEFRDFTPWPSPDATFNIQDGQYNGLLCSGDAKTDGDCSWDLVEVRESAVIVMSGSAAYFRTQRWNSSDSTWEDAVSVDLCTYTDPDGDGIADTCARESTRSIAVYVADIHNNPIPAGSTITASTSNGVLGGDTSYTMPSTNSRYPTILGLYVEPESEPNKKTSGTLTITVTTPKGIVSSTSMTVIDGG